MPSKRQTEIGDRKSRRPEVDSREEAQDVGDRGSAFARLRRDEQETDTDRRPDGEATGLLTLVTVNRSLGEL